MDVRTTSIDGLYVVTLDVIADDRGSFREAWQAEKMEALGLPPLTPVQMNVSESWRGVIRGIHAEPWNKYVLAVSGTAFAVYVDLRPESPSFRTVLTVELTPEVAVYLPKGIGNSFQATSQSVSYGYLVTDHWKPGLAYQAVAFDDPDLAIQWPITGDEQIVSEKDKHNPTMRQLFPNHYL